MTIEFISSSEEDSRRRLQATSAQTSLNIIYNSFHVIVWVGFIISLLTNQWISFGPRSYMPVK